MPFTQSSYLMVERPVSPRGTVLFFRPLWAQPGIPLRDTIVTIVTTVMVEDRYPASQGTSSRPSRPFIIRQRGRCLDVFRRHDIDYVACEALSGIKRAAVVFVVERPLRV